MRHLHITNEAIVPVLNVTRLKVIKNSPFEDKVISEVAGAQEPGAAGKQKQLEDNKSEEEVKGQPPMDSTSTEIVEVLELPG